MPLMLAPHVMTVMSLQIILRIPREMSGEELDDAAASVLANCELIAERRRRADWRRRELAASSFQAECHADAVALPRSAPDRVL